MTALQLDGSNMVEQPTHAGAQAVLSARGLCKNFAGFNAVKNVDLDVHHAKVHALIGPNGAGKTTVFNLLTKFLQPTSGTITLLGEDITKTPPAKVARLGLVRSFQISAIFPHLTVLENVRVALQRPSGLAIQFWRPMSALDSLNGKALELIEKVGLQDARNRQAADLSYGRKRALEIATTLALDPKVLLLDEPTEGLAPIIVDELLAALGSITRAGGICSIIVEQNARKILGLADRVVILERGAIVHDAASAALRADAAPLERFLGVAGAAGAATH